MFSFEKRLIAPWNSLRMVPTGRGEKACANDLIEHNVYEYEVHIGSDGNIQANTWTLFHQKS